MKERIGILTSGGDCPGLNAAIRGVARAARNSFGMECLGFRDGFRGLVLNHPVKLTRDVLSGILTDGGTILGTSRDKPHRMSVDGKAQDMTDAAVATYRKHGLAALVCIGGGGTQKNALKLKEAGLNIVTLPKTIDNDVALTDTTFGFDTALNIVAEAVDRLHSTAMSHQRVIVVEVMGHRAGWLALGGGIAGGADVILIPEIPYSIDAVVKAIDRRAREGKTFSIVVVAEGAMSKSQAKAVAKLVAAKDAAKKKADKKAVSVKLDAFHAEHVNHTVDLTHKLEELTGLESRLTILGHLQRGGTPSAADRILATRLGTACAEVLGKQTYGVMVAARGRGYEAVALTDVAGQKKLVTLDHPWVHAARHVGMCLGDQ
jgi:6-phosphofructokinase 1